MAEAYMSGDGGGLLAGVLSRPSWCSAFSYQHQLDLNVSSRLPTIGEAIHDARSASAGAVARSIWMRFSRWQVRWFARFSAQAAAAVTFRPSSQTNRRML